LVISPDQRHVALTCGSGNTVTGPSGSLWPTGSTWPYQTLDVDPADLRRFYGLYNIGAYPASAAFSPGGRYFYALRGYDGVLVFDAATHAPIGSYTLRADQISV